jgi:ketosteroid isomerase-like protein
MTTLARTAALLGLACLGASCALAADAPAAMPGALPTAVIAQRAEAVRATERAFAKSMADRDLAAFTRFIAPDAVFMDGKDAARGAAAVVAGWRDLFKGAAAPFSWEPETIEVLPTGQLALSSGPVFNAKGERTGVFYSVWRRERDGRWRIVLDHGCDACKDCKG